MSAIDRKKLRQAESTLIMEKLKKWRDEQEAKVLPRSGILARLQQNGRGNQAVAPPVLLCGDIEGRYQNT